MKKIAAVLPYFDSRHFVSQIKKIQSLLLLGVTIRYVRLKIFPFLSSDKGKKKQSEYIGKKGHGGGETTQIRREMRQIQQLLREVKKMKIATYNVRVDTEYDQDWQWSFS